VQQPPPAPAEWKAPLLCFLGANALNAAGCAVWVLLGWGLRGSSYESGRPTAEDVWSLRLLHVAFAAALGLNLGAPALFAIRRKWRVVLGFVAAWVTLPVAYVMGLVLVAILVRAR
jgi:hypothetical protein